MQGQNKVILVEGGDNQIEYAQSEPFILPGGVESDLVPSQQSNFPLRLDVTGVLGKQKPDTSQQNNAEKKTRTPPRADFHPEAGKASSLRNDTTTQGWHVQNGQIKRTACGYQLLTPRSWDRCSKSNSHVSGHVLVPRSASQPTTWA